MSREGAAASRYLRLPGHAACCDNHAHTLDPDACTREPQGTKRGYGRCECGALSPMPLRNQLARRRWHRSHREAVDDSGVDVTVTGHTLVEVVDRYLRELDNPAPDYGQRAMYREWMRELVDQHRVAAGDDADEARAVGRAARQENRT